MMPNRTRQLSGSKLVIVGEGSWGSKVHSVLLNTYGEISSISARAYIQNSEHERRFDGNAIYWICTTPELQFRILEKLIKFEPRKVILEKPYFTTFEQFTQLQKIVTGTSITNFFVSEPWRHSELWQAAKNKILDLVEDSKYIHIQINRSSNELRKFLNPIQDWIPHDLSLIFDLALKLGVREPEILPNLSIKNNLVEGSVSIKKVIKIDFSIGFSSEGRTAYWLVSTGNEIFTIDFKNQLIRSQDFLEFESTDSYSQDHPLINQYEWVSRTDCDPELMAKLEIQKMILVSE